jgi:hypothetical protein
MTFFLFIQGESGLNPTVMSLFNKENIFRSAKNLNQFNVNDNLLNMIKSASQTTNIGSNGNSNNNNNNSNIPMNDNLSNLAKILSLDERAFSKHGPADTNGNEQIEGTVAIVAIKKPNQPHYNVNIFQFKFLFDHRKLTFS